MKHSKEIVTGLILALALVGYLEYRNAPTEKAIREEVRSVYLRPCDATISDRLRYVDPVSPRCYFFKGSR